MSHIEYEGFVYLLGRRAIVVYRSSGFYTTKFILLLSRAPHGAKGLRSFVP